ncbi:MAG: DUF3575 domain-containing protein [Bacteroidales bacterium]|nr:DUF3575 domain-containing protein [Bacteroidales bacterium]
MRLHTVLTLFALSVSLLVSAQEIRRDSVKVFFPQGVGEFDPAFETNGRRLTDFINAAKQARRDSLLAPGRMTVVSCSSPEGPAALNEKLSWRRATGIADYLRKNFGFDENTLEVDYARIDWKLFDRLVRADEKVPARDRILDAIAREDLDAIKALRPSWSYLLEKVFPSMRATLVVFEYFPLPEVEEEEPAPVEVETPVRETPVEVEPVRPAQPYVVPALPDDDEELDFSEETGTGIWLKTNLPALALLDANLALEVALGYRFSVSIPVYYSALDWFSPTAKFRGLGTQPELRLWFKDGFSGPFVAAHGTFGWYNIALPGAEWRFQDRDARHPTYGGGLGLGWRFRLDPRGADRWGLEIGLGAGYLHLDYDVFYNVENGRYARSEVRDYWGPDHASISLTYRLGRKPNSRR